MKHLFRFTFYRRILTSFLVMIVLSAVWISFVTYMGAKQTIADKIKASNESVASLLAGEMAGLIEDITFASNYYIQDPNIRANLFEFRNLREVNSSEDVKLLSAMRDSFYLMAYRMLNPDITLFLVNQSGFIIHSVAREHVSVDQVRQAWMNVKDRLAPNQPNVLQWIGLAPEIGQQGQSSYYIARVIRDQATNQTLATLYISISQTYFTKLFERAATGYVAAFDANAALIAGSHHVPYHSIDRHDVIRSEAVVPRSEWKLAYETPVESVTAENASAFALSLLLAGPFVLGFIMISLILARRLHKPIRSLQASARLFGGGNLGVRFNADGNDEIAELGRTLNDMLDQINRLIRDIEHEQEEKRMLELQALFAQIRPHFLLNTLNSIKCNLEMEANSLYSRKIDSLMNLLKAYMKVNEPDTLQQECQLLRHYVEIMQMRNDLEIQLVIDLEPETEQQFVPKLLLQPIVENAIVHGFQDMVDGIVPCIRVEARLEGTILLVRVADNGEGLPPDSVSSLNEKLAEPIHDSGPVRVGLRNIKRRIALSFGADSSLVLYSNEQCGVTVELRLQLKEGPNV